MLFVQAPRPGEEKLFQLTLFGQIKIGSDTCSFSFISFFNYFAKTIRKWREYSVKE